MPVAPESGPVRAGEQDRRLRHGSWRHLIRSRIEELTVELQAGVVPPTNGHAQNVRRLLGVAEDAIGPDSPARRWPVRQWDRLTGWWNGPLQETAFAALHQAEAECVYLMPDTRLAARLPMVVAYGEQQLSATDERVVAVRRLLERHRRISVHREENHLRKGRAFGPLDRAVVAQLVRDSYAAADEAYAASRAYRNRLIRLASIAAATVLLVLTAAGVWEWTLAPDHVATVTDQQGTVGEATLVRWVGEEPVGTAAFLAVALMGSVGAFLSGITSVSRTGGTRNPFSLPLYQMMVKLTVGALSAIVGILFLQVGYVPGVTPAVTLPALLVWSVAFGAAQQSITRLVDRRVAGLVTPGEETTERAEPAGAAESAPPVATMPTTTSADGRRARSTVTAPKV